jgi:hypothetical protein
MATTISRSNVDKRPPKWLRKLTRVVNIGLIPVVVTTIKGLWVGSDVQLNKILLIITMTLPGLLEILKLITTDDDEEIQTD